MRRAGAWVLMLGLGWCLSADLFADDLSGSDRWLCTATIATRCFPDGECLTGTPADWNIPQFIIFDLGAKRLSTTPASGESRATPIKNIERAEGMVFVQGVEGGRAFGFAVSTASGETTFSVAAAGTTVGGFGTCTPLPVEP